MSGYYSDVLPAHDKVTIEMRFHNDNVMCNGWDTDTGWADSSWDTALAGEVSIC